tara:strand:- start:11709 stop:12029 length:321 start_codon:yes stop_codon:yes gene_type:complete
MTSRYNTTRKDMSTMVDYLNRSTCTAFSASSVQVFSAVCSAFTGETYYHDGSGTWPAAGDKAYSDASCSTPLAAGYYRLGLGSPADEDYIRIMSSDGTITSVGDCA